MVPPESKIYVGTSGWAYSSWKPDFYPAKLASAKFLSYYSSVLSTVEVNYTFRRFPTEKLLQGWINSTTTGFKFAIKANQGITHIKRLRGAGELTSKFVSTLQPLATADKLGPVLFQLPPNLKCDVPLLSDFLAELPDGLLAAFEFRDASWFAKDVFAALSKKNVALCRSESETLQAPDVETADFFYLRLRKDEYSHESLEKQVRIVEDLSKRGRVFIYFKHEEAPDAPARAAELLKALNPA